MGTNNIHADTTADLREALACKNAELEKLRAEALSLDAGDPLLPLVEHDFVTVLEERNEAADDLREAEYGYRNTYPHPAGGVHPGDAYAAQLRRR